MKSMMRQLRMLYGPVKRYLPIYVAALAVVGSRNFVINYLIAFLYSDIAAAARSLSMAALGRGAMVFSVGVLAFVAADTAGYLLWTTMIHRMVVSLKRQVHDSILRADLFVYDQKGGSRSDMLSRINHDMQTAEGVFSFSLLMPVMSLISGIGAAASIYGRSRGMAAYLLCAGALVMAVQLGLSRRVRDASRRRQQAFSRVNTVINELSASGPAIRLAGMTTAFAVRMRRARDGYEEAGREYACIQAGLGGAEGLAFVLQYAGAALLGLWLLTQGRIQVEDLLFIVQLASLVITMFATIGSSVASLQQALAGAERVLELMELPAETEETAQGPGFPEASEEVIATDGFALSISDTLSVRLTRGFVIKKGTIAAVCGRSGRGKSTFFKILLGLYPYDEGSIRFRGRELEEISRSERREQMTYVQQAAFAVPNTIRNNLLLGCGGREPKEEEIERALASALCDTWLPQTEAGLATVIRESGEPLSGGQLQSLALARALLRDAPVLLLDEAFANMNLGHVRQILANIREKYPEKTVLIITHSAEIAALCDETVVFE